MTRFEHLTGRSHHLFDQGVRRTRNPVWFQREGTLRTSSNLTGPTDQRQPTRGNDVTAEINQSEAWRI